MDVLMNDVKDDHVHIPPIRTAPPLVSSSDDMIRAALDILKEAKRPMMMAGTSVKWSSAQQQMVRFLDKVNLPAYANGMGRGTIPRDSKHLFNRTRRNALGECDVLILAGCLLDFRLNYGDDIPDTTKIIQLEMDNLLVGQNRASDVALVGNLACGFEAIMRVMDENSISLDFSDYGKSLRDQEEAKTKALSAEATSDAVPIEAQRLCQDIADFVAEDDVRKAVERGETIRIGPRTIITPLANDLARQHGIFRR